MDLDHYFAYGTTQAGFVHHRRRAELLGEPLGRFRTVTAHAIVVPRRAACSNPGCQYVHRMAALVAGLAPLRAEGDLFRVSGAALAELDLLETGSATSAGPYVRAALDVVALDGSRSLIAQGYLAREPARWRALVELGGAEALARYPDDIASGEQLKQCCVRAPGHRPPHDTVDPLEGVAAG
jgi:hypothetical protein